MSSATRAEQTQVMDGIFYVLRTGCQWNALNATGICSSSTAHRRFQEWRAAGLFEQLWRLGLEAYDEAKGLDWSWLAMDGAMTKAPLREKETGRNPTDWGKQGVKRSILTEANSIPVGVAVAGANQVDFKMTEDTLQSIPIGRPAPTPDEPQGLCLDKGYDYDEVREKAAEHGYTPHIHRRGEEIADKRNIPGYRARGAGWWSGRIRGSTASDVC